MLTSVSAMLKSVLDSRAVLRCLQVLDRRQENRVSEFGMLAQAFEFVKTNGISGDYFEFGLWRGKTFGWARLMARRYSVNDIRFRGFDSFEGLPAPTEKKYNIWNRGQFACGREEFERLLNKKGFLAGEYELVSGFYNQSLTPELSNQLRSNGVRASVIYIDCDLYESSRSAFVVHAAISSRRHSSVFRRLFRLSRASGHGGAGRFGGIPRGVSRGSDSALRSLRIFRHVVFALLQSIGQGWLSHAAVRIR